jgi:glycosyltransferase involved in cell wall biosynthesis
VTEKNPIVIAMVRNGTLKQQHHLTTLCRFLFAHGIKVEFISLQAPADEVEWFAREVPGLSAHHLGKWPDNKVGRIIIGGMALRKQLGRLHFDILYIVDSWTLPYVAFATGGTMRWGKLPMVYHTFDMLVPNVAPPTYIALERHAARRSSLNINTDRSRAEVTKALFSLSKTPLSVPLRLLRNDPLPSFNKHLRDSLLPSQSDTETFLVINPTDLSGERRGKEIIQAFATLPKEYHLITIDGVGSYRSECTDIIGKLGIQDRVHTLSPMSHDDLLKICACADVGLIFYDVGASLGNSLCHPSRLAYFLGLGLPVVATDVPVLEALVYRYSLGVCCTDTQPGSIAKAIQEVCGGSVPLPERKKRIRQAFERELHYERLATRIVDALHGIA